MLTYRPDGTFSIVQFTDTHVGNDHCDTETFDLFDRIMEYERPDLVVMTGDIVHPYPFLPENHWPPTDEEYAAWWRNIVKIFDGYGVPWMFVFGNHEAESSPYEVTENVLLTSEYGLYEHGPADISGYGNYVVPVYDASGNHLRALLWSLDSGMGSDEPSGYDWVKEDQVAWFAETSDRMTNGSDDVTGLAFFHNPLQQHDEVWRTRTCTGHRNEGVCFQGKDAGLYDAFRRNGRVSACFAGHDHTNDFEGTLDGVDLCYGRGSGYRAYGREGYAKGARVIVLREGLHGYESHIRLHDGSLAERPVHHPENGS